MIAAIIGHWAGKAKIKHKTLGFCLLSNKEKPFDKELVY